MDHMNNDQFQVIGGYVSPAHDSYSKHGLLPYYHRIAMCELAVRSEPNMMVDKWESTHEQFQLQYEVLGHIRQELNKQFGTSIRIMYVCGSDLLVRMTMHNLLNDFGVVCAERPGNSLLHDNILDDDQREHVRVMKDTYEGKSLFILYDEQLWKQDATSSTLIRLCINRKEWNNVQEMVGKEVTNYLIKLNISI
jgi:nicotinate (nicotinamide) nucleotide adenylyltransferase